MNLPLFAALFILQFVGHRVGDYLFQTDVQANLKTTNSWARFKHCFVYSTTVAAFTLFVIPWQASLFIWGLTLLEHFNVDTRKPVIWWKNFVEKKLARRGDLFHISHVPSFVIIEIDQTFHYLRILFISILLAYIFQ